MYTFFLFTGLLDLANAYCELILKKLCEQIIKKGMTTDNVAMLYAAAIKFEAKVRKRGQMNIFTFNSSIICTPLLYVLNSLLYWTQINCFLIVWLLVAYHPAENISCVFRTRTSSNTVFLCLLNALVHRTHPLSSPENLGEILVPLYRTQGDSVKHSRQKSSF